jgi:hypothetical protein
MKIGFIVTSHWSTVIRPDGNDLLKKFTDTLMQNVSVPITLYIIDNQSEFHLDIPIEENVKYFRINNQYERGLTGAWNLGLDAAFKDGCDILINCNDDLWFTDTINNFIDYIANDFNIDVVYGALSNGVLGAQQFALGPEEGIKIMDCKSDSQVVNGFFFAFTKEHYNKYRYLENSYFPLKHEHDGGDGKWGGQEGYWIVKSQCGLYGKIVKNTYVPHIKHRAWKIGREIGKTLE